LFTYSQTASVKKVLRIGKFPNGSGFLRHKILRIQSVGLASEFKDKSSEIGRMLKHLFGLPYLPPSEVLDCFTDDLIAIKP